MDTNGKVKKGGGIISYRIVRVQGQNCRSEAGWSYKSIADCNARAHRSI
jgi:hypothetical protein